MFWSVPLVPKNDRHGLQEAASGARNGFYNKAARKLASFHQQDGPVFVRTGWRFNGDWLPWSAAGRERAFVAAFRQFVDGSSSASDRFRFEWNVNMGVSKTGPRALLAGRRHADIIGMDAHRHPQHTSRDPLEASDKMMHQGHGLRWHQDFAVARGKPTAYPEWGATTDDAEPILERVKARLDRHDVVHKPAGIRTRISRASSPGGSSPARRSPTSGSSRKAGRGGGADAAPALPAPVR